MNEVDSVTIDSSGVALRLRLLGDPKQSAIVMLHGMLDVGGNLLPVAEQLAQHYRVVLPDLRGHGASTRCDSYSMQAYLNDLYTIIAKLSLDAPVVWGHSLGGQITTRFAALFPHKVKAIVVAEGIGPPARPQPQDHDAWVKQEGERLRRTLGAAVGPLPSPEFAITRLKKNNPRMVPTLVDTFAAHITETTDDGTLVWAFDPRAPSVFFGPDDGEHYWTAVACPTLLVHGVHAHEYWGKALPAGSNWDGKFLPGELEARAALFRNSELAHLHHSGHMVHFDEPVRLAEVTLDFIRRL